MHTIGFLACETTLPGAGQRRGDAFEHDLMISALEKPCDLAGLELTVIDWEASIEDFGGIDLVLLGTAWNYQDKSEAFLAKLDALESRGITVCNSTEIVRWNIEKTYLRELSDRGAATIPTLWLDDVTSADAKAALDHFSCDKVVVKRQIGAGALGQEMHCRGSLPDGDWRFGHTAMLQPFLPAIADEGELSFIFIDGQLCHALCKRPAKGEYRIQSLYGGTERVHHATKSEEAAAAAILEALPFPAPLYARIDMLRSASGELMVMEAEMIEPFLYPGQGPDLGDRLIQAIKKRVS